MIYIQNQLALRQELAALFLGRRAPKQISPFCHLMQCLTVSFYFILFFGQDFTRILFKNDLPFLVCLFVFSATKTHNGIFLLGNR